MQNTQQRATYRGESLWIKHYFKFCWSLGEHQVPSTQEVPQISQWQSLSHTVDSVVYTWCGRGKVKIEGWHTIDSGGEDSSKDLSRKILNTVGFLWIHTGVEYRLYNHLSLQLLESTESCWKILTPHLLGASVLPEPSSPHHVTFNTRRFRK